MAATSVTIHYVHVLCQNVGFLSHSHSKKVCIFRHILIRKLRFSQFNLKIDVSKDHSFHHKLEHKRALLFLSN